MNILSEIIYLYERKIKLGFTIPKDALVVDFGSGDKPFWRADVFVDKLSLGNLQRASHSQTIHNLGTFVDADIAHLPFKDNAFDFSFSSHLLEHVEDPNQALKEMMRVSKAGYFEVPNGILETIRPFHSHLWFIYQTTKGIVFVRKSKQMHEILQQNGKRYDEVMNKINDPFIRVFWKGKINFEIIDEYKKNEKFYPKNERKDNGQKSKINLYLLLVTIIRSLFYKNKIIINNIYINN